MNNEIIIYGPHCHHDGCAWTACDETGKVEHACRRQDQGCPHCGPASAYATGDTTGPDDEPECYICADGPQRECGACDGSGDDGERDYDPGCHGCGGSPYCACCRKCGASCVADCRCPIPTERGGRTVTV
ncbi:hypothetical protein AB0N38_10660 [Micromonospora aurantiaca]|uniref:hypothetical protein n=1 Tax=Micromonospora aurantiaca (nom. illeg.) TaxID=47850 RepID=UPI0034434309